MQNCNIKHDKIIKLCDNNVNNANISIFTRNRQDLIRKNIKEIKKNILF